MCVWIRSGIIFLSCFLMASLVHVQSLPAAVALNHPAAEAATSAPNPQDLEALLSTLQDDNARQKLVTQIKALVALEKNKPDSATAPPLWASFFSERVGTFSTELADLGSSFLDLPDILRWAKRQWKQGDFGIQGSLSLVMLAIVLLAGFLAAKVTQYSLRPMYNSLGRVSYLPLFHRLVMLFGRLILDAIPIIFGVLAVVGTMVFLHPEKPVQMIAMAAVYCWAAGSASLTLARFFLSPAQESLRLFSLGNETANYAYIWVRRLIYIGLGGYFTCEVARILGLPLTSYTAFLKMIGCVVAIMLIILVLQVRKDVARALQGNKPLETVNHRASLWHGFRVRLAQIWHLLAVVYIIGIYCVIALDIDGSFFYICRVTLLTLLILAMARLAIKGVHTLYNRLFNIPAEVKARFPQLESRANLYGPILEKIVQVSIWILAFLSILKAWGIDSFSWMKTPIGHRIISSGSAVLIVLALAVISWEAVNQWIDRYLNGALTTGEKVQRSARARTFLPFLRTAFMVTLVTIVGLMVLSEIGVNIAPLLAGAGVLGVAIGFGSQALVKDVITGLFYLFEDTISVGDVVNVGNNHSGLVESMSIRTLKLRDFAGAVHTIPFGEVTSVVNMTKDFSYAVFEVGVAYKENIMTVMDVMRKVGEDVQKDPQFGFSVLEPLEIAGLERFDESSIVIKARMKTRPIQQWSVMRAYNLRLKQEFDARGIEIPFPHRTLVISPEGVDKLQSIIEKKSTP